MGRGRRAAAHAGYEERGWWHLDTIQLETVLRARVPRVRYPDGTTRMVAVPWAEKGSRWTLDFEALAVRVLGGVLQREGGLGMAAALRAGSAADHGPGGGPRAGAQDAREGLQARDRRGELPHGTFINDLDGGRVLYVVEKRTANAARRGLASLGKDTFMGVEAVAIDTGAGAAYEAAVSKCCSSAESLKGSRYDWQFYPANMTEKRFLTFSELVARTIKRHLHGLLTWYRHWIANALSESLNSGNQR